MTINPQGKTAILFSGQSSQYQGMGKELLELFPDLSYIYDIGSSILGYDLKEICFNTDTETLSQTKYAQPAILATSVLSYQAVLKLGIKPDMVGGHSLGEYAAMVCSGMISLEDGFKVIKARACAMDKCAKEQNSSMIAVMNVSPNEVLSICDEVPRYVLPVNFNSPTQTVVAGEASAVEDVIKICEERGIRTVKLNVKAAFHSKLMQSAADEFAEAIKNVQFNCPSVAFYSNLYGAQLSDFNNFISYLSSHLVSPVLFTKELEAMHEHGARCFIECGPGKVVTGLVRKTLSGVAYFNVENEKTFFKLKETV